MSGIEKKFDMEVEGFDNKTPEQKEVHQTETYGDDQTYEQNIGSVERKITDPNAITVEISNKIPTIIFLGAKESGKTMSLIRLTRYLLSQGYNVQPDRNFRSSDSSSYKRLCDNFENNVHSNVALKGTSELDFMLVSVTKKGKDICQILEAPGEHYFNDNERVEFPTYIQQIEAEDFSKIWVVFLEIDWGNESIRGKYANQVADMFNMMNPDDKVILFCHKADVQKNYFHNKKPKTSLFKNKLKAQYSAIFNRAEDGGFFSKGYDFVVFSAGAFTKRQDGEQTYIASNDMYPKRFWEILHKRIKGGWF